MDFTASSILALARFTLKDPRAAARTIMAMGIPDAARWLLLGVVATASAVLTHIGFGLLPPQEMAFMADAMSSPLRTAILQGGFLLLSIGTITAVGRWRGGRGNFSDALLLIGWLQFVLLCLQAVQIVALFISPQVAEVIGVLGLVVSLWLLTQFIAELHGFTSGWKVLFGIVVTVFGAAIILSVLMTVLFGTGA